MRNPSQLICPSILFWLFGVVLFSVKLLLVADIPLHIRFSPFDDSLYVSRAYAFLENNAWGKYDPYILSKLPGMSIWLIANRLFGIPYLLGINLFYGIAGLLLLRGAEKVGVSRGLLLVAYAIFLANPITFSLGWVLVMREALSSVLIVALLAVSIHLLNKNSPKLLLGHLFLLGLLFAFSVILREEDKLLWIYLALLAFGVGWFRHKKGIGIDWRALGMVFLIPTLCAFALQSGLRTYNLMHYGAPLLNDYSEGELPKLIASIRSVESKPDNRMVMISQDALKTIKPLLPEFSPVIDALPQPGRLTYSCKQSGVCNEWNSGYMIWWIKQSAAEAGLTPTLLSGQAYFRGVREQIDALCASSALACKRNGDGMFPPFELRWSRAYLEELQRIISLLLLPSIEVISHDAQPVNGAKGLVSVYQQITMTSVTENSTFDHENINGMVLGRVLSEWRATIGFISGLVITAVIILASIALLWRWAMYPNVPLSPIFLLCSIFWIYSIFRILALAYVAVFFGPYESRIIFSTYTGLIILSFLALWDWAVSRQKFRLEN
jgi:hypothetical protein